MGGAWDRDRLIKRKPKQIIKSNSESNTILNDKIEGESIEKKNWVKSKFNVEKLVIQVKKPK